MKQVLFILLSIIAAAMTQSCKSHSKLTEEKTVTTTNVEEEENDTCKVHRVTVTTTQPTPEGGVVKTEEVTETKTDNKKRRGKTQKDFENKNMITDEITPILYNIKRKEKKDSLNARVKEKKEETKQAAAKYDTKSTWIIIICILAYIFMWPIIKKWRL